MRASGTHVRVATRSGTLGDGEDRRATRPPRAGLGFCRFDFACETGERLESSSRGLGGETHRRVLRGDLGSVAERGDVGHRRGGGRGGGIGDGQTGHRLVHRGHRRTRGASEDGAHHGRLGDRGGQSGEGHPRSGGGAHAARRGAESLGEDHL